MNYRNTYVEINLNNLEHNVNVLAQQTKKSLFCVVKANAYGHGAIQVAKFLAKQNDVAYLCVSSLDEALELRISGITFPIIILGYVDPQHIPVCLENNITVSIISLDWFKTVLGTHLNIQNLKFHVKIDSGMNRLGIKSIEDYLHVVNLSIENSIQLEGIFTHYHSADAIDNIHSINQYTVFKNFLDASDYQYKWIHISNSDSVFSFDESVSNSIRIGIALYGYSNKTTRLKPVLSLYSQISQIKSVKKGEVVSYSATHVFESDMKIAILPIGYADGFNRKFQGANLFINNRKVKILGRICMDQTIIEYPSDTKGNIVEIIGPNQTCVDLAEHIDTIPYEILTNLNDRITRKFYYNEILLDEVNHRYKCPSV